MRKSLILTGVLLLLSVGLLVGASSLIGSRETAVFIEAATLYGDPSAAEGITVQLHAGCKGHLFWDILCRAGEKPHATTAFTFSGSERQETQREAPSVSLAFSCDGGISGSGISFEDDDEWGMMTRPAADLAKRTPTGETRTETVSLADYYDTYPLFFDLQLPGQAYNGIEGLQKAVRAYFQLPVPASHRVKVTVQKDDDGNTVNVELSSVGEPLSLSTVSVVTEDGCYFAFSRHLKGRDPLDLSHVPGGYGLYYLPFEKERLEGDAVTLKAGEIGMVFPLDESQSEVCALAAGADEKELFLVTREQDAFWLTVLDTAEMRPSQKFPVLPAGEELSFWQQWVYPDFVALQVSDGGLALLRRGENGVFETAFTCGGGEQWTERVRYDSIFAYDGARLAVATPMDRSLCSFYLSVYEKDGLAYAGQYQNSLDLSPTTDYAYRCRLVGPDPLELGFLPA